MKKTIRNILILLFLASLGYFLITFFNTGGRFFPIKDSVSMVHPNKLNHQIIEFRNFSFTIPNGWEDKGWRSDFHGGIYGILKKDKKVIGYEYGPYTTPPTETLQEFIFKYRNDIRIMGDEIKVQETDKTNSYKHIYPIPSETSDTILSGRLTDSILDLYPKLTIPKIFLGEPNFYSLTSYNDSVYFIPIEVPEVILNSRVSNFDSLGYMYNLVSPKKNKQGYTKITVDKEGSFSVVLLGEDLDFTNQEVLMKVAKSLILRNQNAQYKQRK